MRRRPEITASLCECGRPAARAGQALRGAGQLANGCERCRGLESRRGLAPTIGSAAGIAFRPKVDRPEISAAFVARLNAACDAALALRGIRPPVFNFAA